MFACLYDSEFVSCVVRTKISTGGDLVGVPQTPEGTGTGINLFLKWSGAGTGNENREHLGRGSVWSSHEATGGYNFDAAIYFLRCLSALESVFAGFS